MISAFLIAVSEAQLQSNLRGDLLLVILGSIIAAIGVAAVVVQLSRWRSAERVLLWFGLFAGPYGLRLLMNTTQFQMAFGEQQSFWPFVSNLSSWRLSFQPCCCSKIFTARAGVRLSAG